MNKILASILSIFLLQNCDALDFSRTIGYSDTRARTFLEKKRTCTLAVGFLGLNAPKLADGRNIGTSILCVTDLTEKEGTIEERRGCGLAWYRLAEDTLVPTSDFGTVLAKKPCNSGGFDELLTLPPGEGLGQSVAIALQLKTSTRRPILIYAAEEKYLTWWNKGNTHYDSLKRP